MFLSLELLYGVKILANFEKRDEAFICEYCGYEVPQLGYSSRDHCPNCLCSKHVDKMPGDRAEECRGRLIPISVYNDPKKGYVIIYRCEKCGAIRKNITAKDDNNRLIIKLSGNPF